MLEQILSLSLPFVSHHHSGIRQTKTI